MAARGRALGDPGPAWHAKPWHMRAAGGGINILCSSIHRFVHDENEFTQLAPRGCRARSRAGRWPQLPSDGCGEVRSTYMDGNFSPKYTFVALAMAWI